jgi:dTDP-4-dehydrorhamnose 3,5-epimerase
MQIRPLLIEGAFEFTPISHADQRGAYLEVYRADLLAEAVGHPMRLEQWNMAVTRAGGVRGIHFATTPKGQAKYVTCPAGSGLDVIVDVRVGSPTFGMFDTVVLDDVDRRAVYLAEGLGHAFVAHTDDTVLPDECSALWNPSGEHAVSPLDPALGIPWPETELRLSAKDTSAPTLKEAAEMGLLPDYEDCRRLYARLDEQAASAEPIGAVR